MKVDERRAPERVMTEGIATGSGLSWYPPLGGGQALDEVRERAVVMMEEQEAAVR